MQAPIKTETKVNQDNENDFVKVYQDFEQEDAVL